MCSQQVRQDASPNEPSSSRDPRPAMDILQPLTSFVGRTAQLSAITGILLQPEVRLLILAGPAGVGKTRLAVTAATALVDAFPDGVQFASFVGIRSVDQVPFAIAEALGIHATTGDFIRIPGDQLRARADDADRARQSQASAAGAFPDPIADGLPESHPACNQPGGPPSFRGV